VTHGCMRMVTFAEEIERRMDQKGYNVDTYFELVELILEERSETCGKVFGPIVFFLVLFSSIGFLLSTIIAFKM